jgi:uncharacterized protein YndB with AHSA1/START domain
VAAAGAGAALHRTVVRPWHERWGATDAEVVAVLPGDELLEEPAHQLTRAITIDAPPDEVWPWVVQLGADRGGFYSYDWLENLFGLGIHSADRIVPEWQERREGDFVYAESKGSGGWYVVDVRPGEALVLQVGDPATGRPVRRDEGARWQFQWTFAPRDGPGGTTRLVVRERVAYGSRVTRLVMTPVGLVSFVMTRKMLRGIKVRAEGRHHRGGDVQADGFR